MARKKTPEAEASEVEAEAEAPAEKKSRAIMLTHPETGEEVRRLDYIRELWVTGEYTRGEIARHLSEISNKPVAYQIVFQATKGLAGGPVRQRKAPEAEAPEAPEAPEAA